jgi:hypothetical protein
MGREPQDRSVGQNSSNRGEIRTENSFGVSSKWLSLPTDFDQTRTRCRAWGESDRTDVSAIPLQNKARYSRKTVSASRVKCPSLPTNFDQSFSVCSEWAASDRVDVSVRPLQNGARYGREILSASGVECPYLPGDFDRTSTVCRTRRESDRTDVSVTQQN